MANDLSQPIIKKIKKSGGDGHHGGAWKVAYADFVTAMMAFFLLMWLLNATSEEQKRGISNYFGPVGMADSASGSGGVLGGLSIATEGSYQDSKAAPAVTMLTPQTNAGATDDVQDEYGGTSNDKITDYNTGEPSQKAAQSKIIEDSTIVNDQKNFETAKKEIMQEIQKSPDLASLAENIAIDETPEGLRIQIIDQDNRSMFPIGENKMYDHTVKLLHAVSIAIKDLPNKISISGHTDATPYNNNNNYSNWELSADRANACRRVLIDSNLDPSRISYISGKADTEPLIKSDPMSARNRRISIVLLKTKV